MVINKKLTFWIFYGSCSSCDEILSIFLTQYRIQKYSVLTRINFLTRIYLRFFFLNLIVFFALISWIYGRQHRPNARNNATNSLRKIQEWSDVKCELKYHKGKPEWILMKLYAKNVMKPHWKSSLAIMGD